MDAIYNPMYSLLLSLNDYNSHVITTDRFEMLYKNFLSNLKKIFYSVIYLSEIQTDESFMKKNGYIVQPQCIEYLFQKITTVWDLSYQIGTSIIHIKNINKENKYELLKKEFEKKSQNEIDFKWYREFNKFRNIITHGGLNLITYYENKRIKFQIYNNLVDETIEYNDFFNDGQRPIVFADYYFTYYTIQLYNYLYKFFNFINEQFLKNKKKKHFECDEVYKSLNEQISIYNFEKFEQLIIDLNKNRSINSKYDFYYR